MVRQLGQRFRQITREEGLRSALGTTKTFLSFKTSELLLKPPRAVAAYAFERKFGPGIDVMDRDWDNLILLDACRYDYFVSQIEMEGELEPVVSQGNQSWPFIQANFSGRDLHDTLYVTANPYAERLGQETFYHVRSVLSEWDAEIGTVSPEDVTDAALEAYEAHPNKRLIIHYMQPHQPHIGPTADRIRDRIDITGWDRYDGVAGKHATRTGQELWTAVRSGDITIPELQQAYAESLDIVLDHAQRLCEEIPGRTAISSDHGEMLGDRGLVKRCFGHPEDVHNRELRFVPWFTVSNGTRREIIPEEPIGFTKTDSEVVNRRLEALGYVPDHDQ